MLIRKFWWDQRGEWRKIHWKNRETLCKPKKGGSLGFKELNKFYDNVLTKQVWRIILDTDSLFYCVFKSNTSQLVISLMQKKSLGSYVRKSILKVRWVIVLGAKWRVGDGRFIWVFKDSWLTGYSGGKISSSSSDLGCEINLCSWPYWCRFRVVEYSEY